MSYKKEYNKKGYKGKSDYKLALYTDYMYEEYFKITHKYKCIVALSAICLIIGIVIALVL